MTTTATTTVDYELPSGEVSSLLGEGHEFVQLPADMLAAVAAHDDKRSVLDAVAAAVARQVDLAAILYFDHGSDGTLAQSPQVLCGAHEQTETMVTRSVVELCVDACEFGLTRIGTPSDGLPWSVVAVPVASRDGAGGVMCAVLQPHTTQPPERVAEILQFAALHVSLWCERQTSVCAEHDARTTAALLDALGKVEASRSLDDACRALVNELQPLLGCRRIAVGLVRGQSAHCQLRAVSGLAKFDKYAEFATTIEASLDETILLNETLEWPPKGERRGRSAQTLERLLATASAESVASAPLLDATGNPIGAWLLLDPKHESGGPNAVDFLEASQQRIGVCLQLVEQSQNRLMARTRRTLLGRFPKRRLTAFAAVLLLLVALLAWHRPHRVVCDCQLQPVVRRFVAAPFDGTLEKTLVEPGDVVEEGQVLARMDGRELRLELSALEAEMRRARKKWEASLSLDDIYESQQAKLEMRRLELKIKLLRSREQNLQIKSPHAGVVVSGDLKKSEGAPLTVGQGLFEIAPLDDMRVEVAIPEEDIAYVRPDMEVEIRLDGYPRARHTARLTRIVPRGETRDEDFVFIADAELENASGELRPGMNGRATVLAGRRRLGWLLFHKPYESFLMLVSW